MEEADAGDFTDVSLYWKSQSSITPRSRTVSTGVIYLFYLFIYYENRTQSTDKKYKKNKIKKIIIIKNKRKKKLKLIHTVRRYMQHNKW